MKGASAEFYLNSRKKGVYACALVAVSDYTTEPKFSKSYGDPQWWVSSCVGGKPGFWVQIPQQRHTRGAGLGLRMSIVPVGQRVTLWDRAAPFGLAGSALPTQTYKARHARAW